MSCSEDSSSEDPEISEERVLLSDQGMEWFHQTNKTDFYGLDKIKDIFTKRG